MGIALRVNWSEQCQMARDMGHARQSVQRLADALAKEGLVVYKDNPADQRSRLLELTPQGRKSSLRSTLNKKNGHGT